MIAINFTTARNRFKDVCDKVTDGAETVFVTRKAEKNVVPAQDGYRVHDDGFHFVIFRLEAEVALLLVKTLYGGLVLYPRPYRRRASPLGPGDLRRPGH